MFNTTLQGLTATKAGKHWKPRVLAVPGIVVTKANIDAFLAANHK